MGKIINKTEPIFKVFIVIACFLALGLVGPSLVNAQPTIVNPDYKSTNYGNYFEVINNQAIVYDNRGNSGLVKIGKLMQGETYLILSDYGNWQRIQFGSHYGYVHKENTVRGNLDAIKNKNSLYKNSGEIFIPKENVQVYDNSTGNLIAFAELEKGKEHEIVSDYGNWYRVLVANRVGYVKKTEVTKVFTPDTNYFEVIKENVPVYDNRTGKLIEIGTLEKGQVYPRSSDYGNWHRIRFGDVYGYVRKSDTIPASSEMIKNLNKNMSISSEKFIAEEGAVVYDNSGKYLEPFAKINKGTKFPIVSDYGDWYRILVSDRIGYVRKANVSGYFSSSSKYFEVMADNIVVYDNRKPGPLKKIGELEKGQVYERVSDYGNWHRIKFGDYYGYVSKSGTLASFKNLVPNHNTSYKNTNLYFVTTKNAKIYDNTSGELVPFAELEIGERYPVVSDYGNWYRVLLANKIGYISKNDLKMSFTNAMKYFKVNESNLPIYDNRSGSLVKIGTLTKGQTYKRVSDYGNWHRIQFGDYYGYVLKSSTSPSQASAFENGVKVGYSNGELTPKVNITVYDNTGGSLVPFATIDKGKTYPVVRDYGNWYEVNVLGRYGYVRKSEVNAEVMVGKEIVNPRTVYTYENMRTAINQFAKAYPDLISWTTIGKSVDGRYLYAIKLGTGKKEVHFTGSTHAREWITTNLLMEMIDEYSQAYVNNQSYGGYDVRKILDNTSIWFVPMVNPDGVTLVQKGASSFKNQNELIRINNGSKDFSSWKANIRGIDLNRQYPTDWNTITNNPGRPSPYNFKGYSPLTEPEAVAIMNFSKKHDFKTEVAYHSSGEILYFGDDNFNPNSYMYKLSKTIANMVSKKTGYSLYYTRGIPGGGTYTDFVQAVMNRVGLTPEVSPYVGNRPVPLISFNSIWKENNTVGLMIAKEAYQR